MKEAWFVVAAFTAGLLIPGCGDDGGSEADRLGVGAECSVDADCDQSTIAQVCLEQFKGGYCGVVGCDNNNDCPNPSACVAHEDGKAYCFRTCGDKLECNVNRAVENEANCVSNITYVDDDKSTSKACVPPSSGTE